MKVFATALRCLAALSLGAICIGSAGAQTSVLRVSAIPDEAPTELLRKFKPLGAYLEQETGMKIQFVPVTDYAAVVEALAADKLELAWLGGFTFVQARLRSGNAIPIAQRAEDEKFTSRFIAAAGSGISKLEDLKGKTFAFGSPSSTSGHLMPRYFLLQAGIDPERDFKRLAFSGAHDATGGLRRIRARRRRRAQCLGMGSADRGEKSRSHQGQRVCDHAALLRLQLDRARQSRSRAHQEAHRRVPETRPRQS